MNPQACKREIEKIADKIGVKINVGKDFFYL
jgi:hypothetical protein